MLAGLLSLRFLATNESDFLGMAVQICCALMNKIPRLYIQIRDRHAFASQFVNMICTIVSILFLKPFVSLAIGASIINNEPVIFTPFVNILKLNSALKRLH